MKMLTIHNKAGQILGFVDQSRCKWTPTSLLIELSIKGPDTTFFQIPIQVVTFADHDREVEHGYLVCDEIPDYVWTLPQMMRFTKDVFK